MPSLWLKDSKLVVNDSGAPLLCAQCPCLPAYLVSTDCLAPYRTYRFDIDFTGFDGENWVTITLHVSMEFQGKVGDFWLWQSATMAMPWQPTRTIYFELRLAVICAPSVSYDFRLSEWEQLPGDDLEIDWWLSAQNPNLTEFPVNNIYGEIIVSGTTS